MTIQEEIRKEIAARFRDVVDNIDNHTEFTPLYYRRAAMELITSLHSKGVVIENKEKAIFHHGYFPVIEPLIEEEQK